jgi:hypothetical protein
MTDQNDQNKQVPPNECLLVSGDYYDIGIAQVDGEEEGEADEEVMFVDVHKNGHITTLALPSVLVSAIHDAYEQHYVMPYVTKH